MFCIVKLRPLEQNKIIRILGKNGFIKVREGKQITFKKTDSKGKVWTTFVPHHKEVTIFVLQYSIRQTGKSIEEFL